MLDGPDVSAAGVVVADQLRRPTKLDAAGRAMWKQLTTAPSTDDDTVEIHLQFSAAERVTLELACRQADDLAALEAQLAAEGLVVLGSRGQERLSGLPSEIRLQRSALAKLVHQLALPEAEESEGLSPAQRKAQRAAQARWRREQEAARRLREAAG